ncbi:unnamed protein product [Schistocephalus solidus]|uniref:Nuclear disruption protein n=1 Tax=Schistocephalus solidus TaxID=70667 RepID=A0A183T5L0_SCHSO|nr:unnamed protein product [Schistocephalus solidus]
MIHEYSHLVSEPFRRLRLQMSDAFYLRYYVGHKGKFGHEFLEFEFRPDGKLRYANNSNYKNDTMIPRQNGPFPIELVGRSWKSTYRLQHQKSVLCMFPVKYDGLRTFYYLVQDLKCLVFSLIGLHFKIKPI